VIGWIDCRAGVSGDMLLGALVGAGVPLAVLQAEVDLLDVGITLEESAVTRAGLAATKVDVISAGTSGVARSETPQGTGEHGRTWADVRALLETRLGDPVLPLAVFRRLAEAEARVHGTTPDEVHFHEVGALDALGDVVGVCAGFRHLGLASLTCSPVALGSGTARTEHGDLPVPVPAVLELLAGAPVQAGPAPYESTTPTGAALLAALTSGWGELPPMTPERTGVGAGGHDPASHPNVTRLVIGQPTAPTSEALLETNVDDLDPRLWPYVLERLMAAGANDAWLTPILMKKGRPAHTLSVLCAHDRTETLKRVVFAETTAIGLRETTVAKHALQRTTETAVVDGHEIRVKTAWDGDTVVNRQPEWEDVRTAAEATGRPVKELLQTSVKNASAPTPPASGTPTTS
jgi:uncharacterized protein (TIGR00299 family) protein